MHGLGLPRVPAKPSTTAANTPSKDAWEKPRASGTLESIVNQATSLPHRNKSTFAAGGTSGGDGGSGGDVYGNVLVPWLDPHRLAAIAAATASNTMTMDALVPCSNRTEEQGTGGLGTCMVGGSTRVGSCSTATATQEDGALLAAAAATKHVRVAHHHVPGSSRDQSVSGSATFGRHSQHMTLDTSDMDFGVGFTSTSMGSLENTSSAKQCTKTTTVDDHDSVCHSRSMVIKPLLARIIKRKRAYILISMIRSKEN